MHDESRTITRALIAGMLCSRAGVHTPPAGRDEALRFADRLIDESIALDATFELEAKCKLAEDAGATEAPASHHAHGAADPIREAKDANAVREAERAAHGGELPSERAMRESDPRRAKKDK